MKEAWICPKCNIGVAPHCDTCPNCTKPLDLIGVPIEYPPMPYIDPIWRPLKPPYRVGDFPPYTETVSSPAITTPYSVPYNPNITAKWSVQ